MEMKEFKNQVLKDNDMQHSLFNIELVELNENRYTIYIDLGITDVIVERRLLDGVFNVTLIYFITLEIMN